MFERDNFPDTEMDNLKAEVAQARLQHEIDVASIFACSNTITAASQEILNTEIQVRIVWVYSSTFDQKDVFAICVRKTEKDYVRHSSPPLLWQSRVTLFFDWFVATNLLQPLFDSFSRLDH